MVQPSASEPRPGLLDHKAALPTYFAITTAFCVAVAVWHKSPFPRGDEWRYLWYAENLVRGYFSPPEYVFLWSGPGYPLFVAPFIAAGAPQVALQVANGLLIGAAHVMFFAFARQHASLRTAWLMTVALTLYLPILDFAPFVYTEPLTFFLITTSLYLLTMAVQRGTAVWLVLCGVCLAWLTITKVSFWPMVFGGFGLCSAIACLGWIRHRAWTRRTAQRVALAFGLGALGCVPYLVYTYQVTGRVFYWGSGGGSVIYWISNPHGQYGEWFHNGWVEKRADLRKHHYALFKSVGAYDTSLVGRARGREKIARMLAPISSPQADDVFKARGLANIRAYPDKYLRNVAWNLRRLLFDTPYTVRKFHPGSQRMAVSHFIMLLAVFAAAIRLARGRVRAWPFACLLAWMFLSYLGPLALVSAVGRYTTVIVPVALALVTLAFAEPLDRWLSKRPSPPAT